MDIEDLRATMTVVSFAAFLGIVAWAYGHGRSARFSEAARLPFDDEAAKLPWDDEADGTDAASKQAEGQRGER